MAMTLVSRHHPSGWMNLPKMIFLASARGRKEIGLGRLRQIISAAQRFVFSAITF
jgi:hypothetical protein